VKRAKAKDTLVNQKDGLPKEFVQALKTGNIDGVQAFLNVGVDLNKTSGKKTVLELIPARANELKRLLIKAGARHADLKQALVWGVNQDDRELLQALLDYGADVNQRARSGTPLMAAIGLGSMESLDMLLQAGADPSIGTTTATALSKAVVRGQPSMVRRLLEQGCDPNLTPTSVDLTALHTAVFYDQRECLEILLDGGADPNLRATQVTTGDPAGKLETHTQCPPLHLAIHTGRLHLVPVLIARGADPSQVDGEGRDLQELSRQLGVTLPGNHRGVS
jgi:ankyrin repeat protein